MGHARYLFQDILLARHVILKIREVVDNAPLGPRDGDILREFHMENLGRQDNPYFMEKLS